MSSRVLEFFASVVIGVDHGAIRTQQHGPDRHVVVYDGTAGFRQGSSHGGFELGSVHVPLHYGAVGGIA